MFQWILKVSASRGLLRGLGALVLCTLTAGCELDRPNFQMNSNSPTPFFGIDLLPRRKTTSLVSPQAGPQIVSDDAVAGSINTVEETPSRRRFWQRNAKALDQSPTTIVLPLSKLDPDQTIDRGPVELLP